MNTENMEIKNKSHHWSDDEINYLKENYQAQSYKEIAKQLGRTDGAIRAKLNDLKLVKKTYWSNDEIDYLIANYEYMTYKELSENLNRSEDAIQLKLKKLGYKKSPYYCNQSFFETIDTEEKAYWLGFLYADGYVIINHQSNSGTLGIDLQRGDKKHLELFNKCIKSNYKIVEYEKKLNEKKYKMVRLRIFSRNLAQSLIDLGCTERKSKTIMFPKLDEHLYPHFIRGYFDGDGCISLSSTKTKQLSIDFTSGSFNFITSLRQFLFSLNIFSYIYTENDKNTYRLYIRGLKNLDTFWNYMYKNANIYLKRKLIKKEQLYKTYEIAQRLPR